MKTTFALHPLELGRIEAAGHIRLDMYLEEQSGRPRRDDLNDLAQCRILHTVSVNISTRRFYQVNNCESKTNARKRFTIYIIPKSHPVRSSF